LQQPGVAVENHSPWIEFSLPPYPALDHDLEVDVVVVGGGVTGLTAAYLLRQEGARVAVIERDRIAQGDTARTTAHLTYVTDSRLHELADKLGKDAAKALWEGGAAAIDEIARIAQTTGADCGFTWVPGYLHASLDSRDAREADRLRDDAALAVEFGFDAAFQERVPYADRPGVRFANQAKFHPRRYLAALAETIPGNGSHIFENTSLEEVSDKPMAVRANGKRIRCKYLIIATHNPLSGKKGLVSAALFQTKLALYTSYVLGARLPEGTVPEALFWDTADPYHYLRVDTHQGYQYAIFGGKDVKTGQERDAEHVFQRLEGSLRSALPNADVTHRWLGQVIETDDGLPFIGENAEAQFIATGFSGNGFTFGTLAAVMARDWYLKRANPWSELFRVDRSPFHGGLWQYLKENVDYPYYFLRDRMSGVEGRSLEVLGKSEGKILELNGRTVAAYRDKTGKVTFCSPICTHLKCLVRWNAADATWDCPCHGSRFRPTGEVIGGPAEDPLEQIELPAKV
jgi:glycine/D-amino acid oxidase-like deaminating enzyme/nitrite reductase/ring-hydroxylating ferredoxin subunit